MKKNVHILLSIISLMLLFGSCSKPKKEEVIVKKSPFGVFMEELGIPEGIEVRPAKEWDPDDMILLGKKDYTIYLYKIKNRKIVAKHIEHLKKEVKIDLDLGFGEKKIIDLKHFLISNTGYIFTIGFLERPIGYIFTIVFSERPIEDGRTGYSIEDGRTDYYGYYYWVYHNNEFKKIDLNEKIVSQRFNSTNLDNLNLIHIANEHFVFNNDWNFLYLTKFNLGKVLYASGVDDENIITFSLNQISKGNLKISKVNLKQNKIIWRQNLKLENDEQNIRIDNKEIIKEGNIWTFIINYTLYNGEKKVLKVKVNLKSGVIIK